jgi:hypothetical protein
MTSIQPARPFNGPLHRITLFVCVVLALALLADATGSACPQVFPPPQSPGSGMYAPARYHWYISYAFSDDPSLNAQALQLDSAALIERERCNSIGATGGSGTEYLTTCEVAFRERVASIPSAHFILGFCASGQDCPRATRVGDLPLEDAINPNLDHKFEHTAFHRTAALGVYSTAAAPCKFVADETSETISYQLPDATCTAAQSLIATAESTAASKPAVTSATAFTPRSAVCTRKDAAFLASWKIVETKQKIFWYAASAQLNFQPENPTDEFDCFYSSDFGYILDEYGHDENQTPKYFYEATVAFPRDTGIYEDQSLLQTHLTTGADAMSFLFIASNKNSPHYGFSKKGCIAATYINFDSPDVRHEVSEYIKQNAPTH